MLHQPLFLLRRPWSRKRLWENAGLVSLILASILIIFFLIAIDRRVRPVLVAMATTSVSNAVTESVNQAILDGISSEHISYGDIVKMEVDSGGHVSALTSNLENANLLRAQMLSLVLDAVSQLSSKDFSIPMGNLSGLDVLSGFGPDVTVHVLSTGTASAAFSHAFLEAGVNQTLHQIMLDLEVIVQILLPGETIELPVLTSVCIAETIIVGQVPNTYLEWEH